MSTKRTKNNWRSLGFDSNYEYDVYTNSVKRRTEHHPSPFKYTVDRKYYPDFKIKTKSGKTIYIETKGYWKASDRTKHLRVCQQNEGLDLRLVFMNSRNKLNKRSTTTYAEYCDAKGIIWAEGNIPKEWYNE